MIEDQNGPKEKKKDDNDESGEYDHPEESTTDNNCSDQPVYLDEIILENVEKTISQTKNVKLPTVEDMKKMVGAYETIKNIGQERKQESVKKDNTGSSNN